METRNKNYEDLLLFVITMQVYASLKKYRSADKFDLEANQKKLSEVKYFIQEKYGIMN